MTKPTLLFLHGFRGGEAGLAALIRALEDFGFSDCHAPALPPSFNHRLSHYDPQHYADFVATYIRRHQLVSPVLIGHSMGSLIAAATAQFHPDLINHQLILISPISSPAPRFLATFQSFLLQLPPDIVSYLTTRYLFVPRDHRLFTATLDATNASAENYSDLLALSASACFACQHSLSDFSFTRDTLLLAGAHDRLVPRIATENYARRIGAQCEFIPDSGHLVNYEKPAILATRIAKFLEKNTNSLITQN